MIQRDREATLWKWLKRGAGRLHSPEFRVHLHRLEDVTKSGTPDVEGKLGPYAQFLMELKVAYEQVHKPVVRVKTTDKQVYFALQRRLAGGLSWYLVRVGTHPDFRHYLLRGELAEALLNKPVSLSWLDENCTVEPCSSATEILLRAGAE